MAILLDCECGHRLEAADEQAGQQVPCPACGRSLQLPEAYNPLSTMKYLQLAPEPEAVEPPPEPSGPECPTCAGSGDCVSCSGSGRLQQSALDRVSAVLSGAVSGFVSFLSDALGAGGPKKYKTRSEQRRASACPRCEGSGQCFTCEGTGQEKA